MVVGAEVSGKSGGFGNVEVAGRSGMGGACRSWGASSARTKVAEMPLELAQRTSASQAPRRDLLMRLCELASDEPHFRLCGLRNRSKLVMEALELQAWARESMKVRLSSKLGQLLLVNRRISRSYGTREGDVRSW